MQPPLQLEKKKTQNSSIRLADPGAAKSTSSASLLQASGRLAAAHEELAAEGSVVAWGESLEDEDDGDGGDGDGGNDGDARRMKKANKKRKADKRTRKITTATVKLDFFLPQELWKKKKKKKKKSSDDNEEEQEVGWGASPAGAAVFTWLRAPAALRAVHVNSPSCRYATASMLRKLAVPPSWTVDRAGSALTSRPAADHVIVIG